MGAKCTRYGTLAFVYGNFGGANYSGGALHCPQSYTSSYDRWLHDMEAAEPISVPDYMYKLHDMEYGMATSKDDITRADCNLVDRLRKSSKHMDWVDYFCTRFVILLYAMFIFCDIQNYTIGPTEIAVKRKAKVRMERIHDQTMRAFDKYIRQGTGERGRAAVHPSFF